VAEAQLAVWLQDTRVGQLRDGARGVVFTATDDARALTAAAQGAGRPWSREFTRNWFDNLLPDGPLREEAARIHGVSPTDLFALLGAIGWECAGAISVLPEGRRPASGSYRHLSDDELWQRLESLPSPIGGEEDVHMSLGGAQEKLVLRRTQDGWDLPLDGAISTHILRADTNRKDVGRLRL